MDISPKAQAFLDRIEATKRRTAELERARPGPGEVGRYVRDFHRAFHASLWSEPSRARQLPLQPLPAAPGHQDGTANLNPDNRLVLEELHISLTAARDHLLGLGNVLVAGGPARTAVAVARILLDASAHSLWLLDPTIDGSQRAVRAANLRLEALRQEIADDPSETLVKHFEKQRADLIAGGIADGFEQVMSKRGEPQMALSPPYSRDSVWEVCEGKALAVTSWRVNSSAVHARERESLLRDLGVLTRRRAAAVGHATLQRCIYPALLASEVALEAGKFYGVTGEPISVRTIGRYREALAFGAGLRDDKLVPHDSSQ